MRLTFKLEGTIQLKDDVTRDDGEFVRILMRKNIALAAEHMEKVTDGRPYAFVEVRTELNTELPSDEVGT